MRWFRGCKVYEGDAGVACFSLQRGSDAPPFDDATLVLLERIRPHLSRFFRMALQAQAAIPALASAGAAMDMLRMAVCVVDAQCQVRYANPAAEELLGQGTMLKVKSGQLFSPHPQANEMLRHAVTQASRPPRQASVFSPEPTGSAVSRLQVRAVPLAPHLPMAHYGHGNLVLLFLATGAPQPQPHELQKLFGLTRAEAGIVEMLVQGATPEVCARRRGVSVLTVRTHVASILAKTGVGSQAQLMSLVLALPAVR
jgi:DNA-binding CsgD family transcriptional regulator